MTDLPPTIEPSLSALLRREDACERFEADLRAGLCPRPADYLALVPLEEQDQLLIELEAVAAAYGDEVSTRKADSSEVTPPAPAKKKTPVPLPEKIGRYRIIAKLGKGGMGIVYKAWHPVLDQSVALKTILHKYVRKSAMKDRLIDEARKVAKLKHPHIVPVYDADEEDGLPFFTMALIEGGSLADRLAEFQLGAPILNEEGKSVGLSTQGWTRKQLRQRKEKLLTLMEKVCCAVHAAHANDPPIIHRDLKPGNILMEGDEPLVSDFGLAMVQEAVGEDTGRIEIAGTPHYMAPEQHRGATGEIGPATDVWAIGVILYQLCTGRLPFASKDKEQLKEKILTKEPPRPRQVNSRILPDLDAIIFKCLNKDAAFRFTTLSELADELGRCRQGEFTHTHPPTVAQRITSAVWHSAMAKAAATLLATLAVTAGTLSLWPGLFNVGDSNAFEIDNEAKALEMQRELGLGKPVRLLTEEGLPRFSRIKDFTKKGSPKMAVLTASSGELVIEQRGDFGNSSLITLLRDPACESYEFTGEVRHDAAGEGGYIGICALGSERFTTLGTEYTFFGLAFADVGGLVTTGSTSQRAHSYIDAFLHREVSKNDFHARLLDSTQDSLIPTTATNGFRKFRIGIQRTSLALYFDEQLVATYDRDRLRSIALDRLGYLRDPDNPPVGETVPPEFREINRGFRDLRLGDAPAIYVRDSTVTLRKLKLTPTSR